MEGDQLLDAYRRMVLIRTFEEKVEELYIAAEIPGFVHVSTGQEACAVGVCFALGEDDFLTSTHRGHGHCLARGMRADRMMAELFGKADGYCGGKGGSMHIADPALGVLGANGIVGAGVPIAIGAAAACQLRGSGVAVSFFGEGATTTGAFHEALSIAVAEELPTLFVCENNKYVEFSAWEAISAGAAIADRAAAYGLRTAVADGNDVEEVHAAAAEAVSDLRRGAGPVLLELDTYRITGHYAGDPAAYRPDGELEAQADREPLSIASRTLRKQGLADDEDLARMQADAEREVAAAVEFARSSPYPDAGQVLTDV